MIDTNHAMTIIRFDVPRVTLNVRGQMIVQYLSIQIDVKIKAFTPNNTCCRNRVARHMKSPKSQLPERILPVNHGTTVTANIRSVQASPTMKQFVVDCTLRLRYITKHTKTLPRIQSTNNIHITKVSHTIRPLLTSCSRPDILIVLLVGHKLDHNFHIN